MSSKTWVYVIILVLVLGAAGVFFWWMYKGGKVTPKAADTPTASPQSFPDVDPTYWAYTEIEYMNSKGWMVGYPSGNFQPDSFAPREQVAAAIARAHSGTTATENKVSDGPATPSFIDVPTTNVFYNEIEYVKAQGIMNGYPDGTFRPTADARTEAPAYESEYATRGTMGPVIARAKSFPTPEPATLSFVDVQRDETLADGSANPNYYPHYKEIEALKTAGLINGCRTETNPNPPPATLSYYCPKDNLTRAVLAVFISRAWPSPVPIDTPTPTPIVTAPVTQTPTATPTETPTVTPTPSQTQTQTSTIKTTTTGSAKTGPEIPLAAGGLLSALFLARYIVKRKI